MDNESRAVGGFVFPTSSEAQLARQEQKNIDIIRSRTPLDDPKAAHDLYCKLIERDMFKTMIGHGFLYELRNDLVTKHGYNPDELPTITVTKRAGTNIINESKNDLLKKQIEQLKLAKTRLTIVMLALIAMIAGMFIIAVINPNIGYVNTEQKVLNKYSACEEDLKSREETIKQKEKELNINEAD